MLVQFVQFPIWGILRLQQMTQELAKNGQKAIMPPMILSARGLRMAVNNTIEQVIAITVKKTLLELGLDVSDPEAVIEMQKDFAHLRAWRGSVEEVKRKGFMAAAAVIATGIVGLLWASFKASLH